MHDGKKSTALIIGITLLVGGALLLLDQFEILQLNGSIIWGSIMLAGSLVFHIFAIARRNGGLAYPAGVLLVYGGLVLTMGLVGWEWMRLLWPLWIFGAAVGGIEQKLISRNHEGSWYSVLLLLAITAGCFAITAGVFDFTVCLGIFLVLVGLLLVLRPLFSRTKNGEKQYASYTVHYEVHTDAQPGAEPVTPPPSQPSPAPEIPTEEEK